MRKKEGPPTLNRHTYLGTCTTDPHKVVERAWVDGASPLCSPQGLSSFSHLSDSDGSWEALFSGLSFGHIGLTR